MKSQSNKTSGRRFLTWVSCMLLLQLSTACGGGGGSTSSAVVPENSVNQIAPASIQAGQAWNNLLTTGGAWTAAGKDSSGNLYTATVVIEPGPDKSYNDYGVTKGPFNTTTIASTTLKNGLNVSSKSQEIYTTKDTNEIKFGKNSSYCFVSISSFRVPVVAILNSGGSLFTANTFNNCINFGSDGTTSASWSYEAENGIPFFCTKIGLENTCIEVNTSGGLDKKMKLTSSGVVLRSY